MDWMSIIQLVMGGALTGFLSTILTLRATRKKADSEAKGQELDNVQEAVKIWRELAETFRVDIKNTQEENCELTKQIEGLRKEVVKLTSITKRVLALLDKVTHDNLDQTVKEIRNEMQYRIE